MGDCRYIGNDPSKTEPIFNVFVRFVTGTSKEFPGHLPIVPLCPKFRDFPRRQRPFRAQQNLPCYAETADERALTRRHRVSRAASIKAKRVIRHLTIFGLHRTMSPN